MIGIMLESVFQGWPGYCVVFLGKTLNSRSLSPSSCLNEYGRISRAS